MGAFGTIAGGHKDTVDAAENILKDGGNSFDAAIAGVLFLLFLSIYIQALLAAGPFLLAKKTKRLSCLIFLLKAQKQKEEK